MDSKIPFNANYVMRVTYKHMLSAVEVSIRKTVERIAEFDSNSEKSTEILQTLGVLYKMRKELQEARRKFVLED